MKPLSLLVLLALPAFALAPAAAGDIAPGGVDLGGLIDAGQFRAARLRLLEPQPLEVGGVFDGAVATPQPVLPIFAALRAPEGWGALALFTYDFHFDESLPTSLQLVAPAVGTQHLGTATTNEVLGGGWVLYHELPAGEYVLVVAAAPGAGKAEVKLRTFGATEVVAVQDGTTFFDRGLDRSAVAYDLFVQGHQGPLAGTHVRTWGYSGAELPFQVAGRMYGYVGYHQGLASWGGPSGTFTDAVVDEPPGAWTASFPQENWEGPTCLPRRGCLTALGDSREDPPFAIAADVRV